MAVIASSASEGLRYLQRGRSFQRLQPEQAVRASFWIRIDVPATSTGTLHVPSSISEKAHTFLLIVHASRVRMRLAALPNPAFLIRCPFASAASVIKYCRHRLSPQTISLRNCHLMHRVKTHRSRRQVEFFQLAVEHGCADAFGELSLCYQYSKGVKCNDRVAFELALQVQ